jgi:hypothetical protein
MQSRPAYPLDAVTGGCFVTRRYEIAPGEQICDLDCDLEALPAWGRLCVSELGVRMMANCLGIEIPEDNILDANAKLREENRRLRTENTSLRKAIAAVLDAAELANLEVIAASDNPVAMVVES